MAQTGRLGVVELAATTNTSVYQVATGLSATVSVSFLNRNVASATVRLALVDGAIGALVDEDYIEFDVVIPPNGILERGGIVLSSEESVIVYSDVATVNVRVHGFEE